MKKSIMFTVIFLIGILNGSNSIADRVKELGVLDYFAEYKWKESKRCLSYARQGKLLLEQFVKMGTTAEMVSPDIFDSDQKEKRNIYKRIFIPWYCYVFSMEHYQGMEDYVKSGGLLITSSGLSLYDSNNDKTFQGDKETNFPANTFMGVNASWGFNIQAVKVIKTDSILVKEVSAQEWMPLKQGGRKGQNISAEIIMNAKGRFYEKIQEMAFFTLKNYGKGACIFIAAPLSVPNIMKKYPLLKQIAINCFSPQTYEELCLP